VSARPVSEVTRRARTFVEAHLSLADGLGLRLVDLLDDADVFVPAAEAGLAALGDPAYEAEVRRMIPGLGRTFGVRGPLHGAVTRPLRPAVAELSPAESLKFAERLSRTDNYDIRSLAFIFLRRSLPADPERTWQVIRQMAANSTNWAHVDGLAGLVASGIVREPYRWAELEPLTYSQDRWERRLVASTIATLPSETGRARWSRLVGAPALGLLGLLIGDADIDVQKALSWALRSWILVEPAATEAFLAAETERAARDADGHRAWVIRDALPALPAERARQLRDRLAGVRRRTEAPSTSRAAGAAATVGTATARTTETSGPPNRTDMTVPESPPGKTDRQAYRQAGRNGSRQQP
jgi:3-methyladenine DNA glycosylase AlkD